MGLFNAAANLFGQVYERATQVAATAVTAVADINQRHWWAPPSTPWSSRCTKR